MSYDGICSTPNTPSDLQNSLNGYNPLSSNSLSDLLTSQSYSASEYDSKIRTSRGGWEALAVITLLLYLVAVINIVWIRLWPHKAKGLFKYCGKPRTQRFKNIFLGGSLLLCIAVLATGIAGAALEGHTRENGERATCEFNQVFNEVIQGSPSDKWGGITRSQTSYMRLRDRFSKEVADIDVTFSTNTTDVEIRLEEYNVNLDLLYNTRTNYYVKSANYSDSPLDLIVPEFIDKLGPKETAGTYLSSLVAEGNTLLTTVENSAEQLDTDVTKLKQLNSTIQAATITAADGYNSFSQILSNSVQEMSAYMNGKYSNWLYLYKRAYAASIVFIVLSIFLFATIIYRFKRPFPLSVQLAYVFWHLMMIWTIVSFFFAADLQAMKKRSSEYCDVFNRMAGDSEYLDGFVPQYPSAFTSTLKSCFHDQGETFRTVGLEQGTLLLSDISQNIKNVEPYLVGGPGSQEVQAQRDLINQYIQGLLLIDGGALDAKSPQANLNVLNSWASFALSDSNQATLGECEVSKDTWVLNTTNCTSSMPFNSAYDADDYFGESMCLGIFSVDSGTIPQRYNNQNFASCNPVNGQTISDILIQEYNGLNRHFDDVRRKFRRLDSYYENNLEGSYEEMLRAASTLTGPITSLNSSFGDYLDFISGSENGILNNANCAFFNEKLLNANYFLCEMSSGIGSSLGALVAASVLSLFCCIFTYFYFRKLEAFNSITYNQKELAMSKITPEPIPQDMPKSSDWDSQGKSSDDIGTKEDL